VLLVLILDLAMRTRAWLKHLHSTRDKCQPSERGVLGGCVAAAVLYAASRGTLLFVIFSGPDACWATFSVPFAIRLAACGLLAGALCLLVSAHRALGSGFTLGIRPLSSAPQGLVTSGPYAWIRHPLYAAEVLLLTGYSLFSGNLVLASVGAALALVLVRRIGAEERHLVASFGDEYLAYQTRTGNLLPRIRG